MFASFLKCFADCLLFISVFCFLFVAHRDAGVDLLAMLYVSPGRGCSRLKSLILVGMGCLLEF